MKLQIGFTPLMRDIREAKTFRAPKNIILKILIFVGVFLVLQIVESFAIVAALMPRLMEWAAQQMEAHGSVANDAMLDKLADLLLDPANTTIMLVCTGFGTLLVLLYCRVVEGRKLHTMGFYKKGWWWKYLVGLLCGFTAFSMVIGISMLMGGLHYDGYRGQFGQGLLLVFIGFLVQGMSEEVFCRGFMMTTTLRHQNVWWAVAVNVVGFALAHGANPGFSLLAFVNLMLYAGMISLYVLRTNDLWGACAFHSIWNFAQGNFYGLPVSGIDAGDTVFAMSLTGSPLANGGEFGLEASLATTIVMIVWILVLLFVPNPFAKKQDAAPAEAE